jgi:hypothetical protein
MTACLALSRIVLAAIALAALPAIAAPTECVQEKTATRLDTLRVASCLLRASPASDVVATLRQTLTNVGTRPIELDLYRDARKRASLSVHHGTQLVSKPPSYPVADGPHTARPGFEFHRLKPGESVRFDYAIADSLTAPPDAGPDYAIGANQSFDYRFDDEAQGQAHALRRAEEDARSQYLGRVVFHGVRLH